MPRNISVVSEDPKVQERREKARAAYAKKKAMMTSTQVSQVSTQVSQVSPEKAKAKSTLANAIKNKIARKVLETKKDRKVARNEKFNLYVNIELPMSEVELYFAQYPKYLNYIKNTTKQKTVQFSYKPFLTYDLFIYSYNLKEYQIKIQSEVDINYSSYLYDTFYEPSFEKYNKKLPEKDKIPPAPPTGNPPPLLKNSNPVKVNKPEWAIQSSSSSRSSMPSSSSSSSNRSSSMTSSTSNSSSSSNRSSMPSSTSSSSSVGSLIFNKYKYSLAS
jgi:hypothetical protein